MALINLLKLLFLLIALAPWFLINKTKAIYYFLKFSGPSFLKLGQALSMRPDVVGEELSQILSNFQDNLPCFCSNKVKSIIKKEYKKNFNDIFLDFDFDASASASIAQVHKATLKTGEVVAVKILRPNIESIIYRDIRTLRLVANIFGIFSSFLANVVSDIEDLLKSIAKTELDLLLEAANASKIKEDLKDVKGIYVPKIFWQFSTRRILVIEWIDGIAFSNRQKISQTTFDKKQLARNLVICYFEQVYNNGFFHGDMHGGNLFLMNDGNIALVDFGIVGKLDKKTRLNIAEILVGFLDKDYDKVAKLHIEGGLVDKTTRIEDLSLSCRKIGETIIGSDVKDISVAKLLENLLIMTKQYNMKTRPDLLLLQKTILLIEGIAVSLDPDVNIWQIARPWVKKWAKRNISFDAKIRDYIIDFVDLAKNFLRNLK